MDYTKDTFLLFTVQLLVTVPHQSNLYSSQSFPTYTNLLTPVCVLKNNIVLLLTGVACLGRWVREALRVYGGCEEQITERLERKAVGLEARPKAPPIYFWPEADFTKIHGKRWPGHQ